MSIGYEIIDGGQGTPYHLLCYMIAQFSSIPNNVGIVYYFPKGCEFAEKIFGILPNHWIRHYEKQPEYIYTTDHIRVPAYPDYMMPGVYDYLRFVFSHHISKQIIAKKYIYTINFYFFYGNFVGNILLSQLVFILLEFKFCNLLIQPF